MRLTCANKLFTYLLIYLPGKTDIPYQLRTRSHRTNGMTLINKTKFVNDADFIIRLL